MRVCSSCSGDSAGAAGWVCAGGSAADAGVAGVEGAGVWAAERAVGACRSAAPGTVVVLAGWAVPLDPRVDDAVADGGEFCGIRGFWGVSHARAFFFSSGVGGNC